MFLHAVGSQSGWERAITENVIHIQDSMASAPRGVNRCEADWQAAQAAYARNNQAGMDDSRLRDLGYRFEVLGNGGKIVAACLVITLLGLLLVAALGPLSHGSVISWDSAVKGFITVGTIGGIVTLSIVLGSCIGCKIAGEVEVSPDIVRFKPSKVNSTLERFTCKRGNFDFLIKQTPEKLQGYVDDGFISLDVKDAIEDLIPNLNALYATNERWANDQDLSPEVRDAIAASKSADQASAADLRKEFLQKWKAYLNLLEQEGAIAVPRALPAAGNANTSLGSG